MGRKKAKLEDVVGRPAVKAEELPALDVKPKIEAPPVVAVRPKTEDKKYQTFEEGSPSEREPDDALPMSDMARMLIAKHEEANGMTPEEAAAEKYYSLEYAKSGRSVCKGKCSRAIPEGAVRFGSSDTSNGYAMTMWRCLKCVTGRQLENVQTLYNSDSYSVIRGWRKLTDEERADATSAFDGAREKGKQLAIQKEAARVAKEEKKKTQEVRRNRRERFVSEPGDWFDWKTLLDDGELAAEQASFLRIVCDWVGVDSSGTKAKLLQKLSDCKDPPPPLDSELATEQEEQPEQKSKKRKRRGSSETEPASKTRPTDDVASPQKSRKRKIERPSEAESPGNSVPPLRRSQRVRTTRTLPAR